jgi:hypothetical protein
MKTLENSAKEIKREDRSQDLSKEEAKKKLQRMKEKDAQIVKGVFRFHEMPGGTLSFTYKAYKGQNSERYDLTDGQIYSIPLGVAKHLNVNGWYPEYEYIKGETFAGGYGNHLVGMKIAKKVHRYGFSGLDFVDEDLEQQDKQIFTVTAV